MPTDMFNYREVFSSWEAFGWKLSEEDAPRMPISSSLNTMTRSHISYKVDNN